MINTKHSYKQIRCITLVGIYSGSDSDKYRNCEFTQMIGLALGLSHIIEINNGVVRCLFTFVGLHAKLFIVQPGKITFYVLSPFQKQFHSIMMTLTILI